VAAGAEAVRGVFARMEMVLRSAVEEGQRNREIDPERDAGKVASLLPAR
jgi:hypothetical protein